MNIENINFESIIKRIKELKNLRDDQEVAALLGMSKGAFSERKRRCSVPKKELELLCERESINMHWLLTGEGEMRREEKEQPLTINEETAIHKVKEDSELAEIIQMLKEHPQDRKLVLKLLKGKKDIKEALEGFEISKIREQEG